MRLRWVRTGRDGGAGGGGGCVEVGGITSPWVVVSRLAGLSRRGRMRVGSGAALG
jgi:hypothetical protein